MKETIFNFFVLSNTQKMDYPPKKNEIFYSRKEGKEKQYR